MPATFVLTVTGPDRIGIVEEVTGLLLDRGGNVETSRMARLGGEFAALMLVALPESRRPALDEALATLTGRGYTVSLTPADRAEAAAPRAGWLPYRIAVEGADHEGIIHEVARYLSGRGIHIEAIDSDSAPAPTSGVPLFSMIARVEVPPHLPPDAWQPGLAEVGTGQNLDIQVFNEPLR